ncbi:hypothetical protein EBESD8_18850 [Rhodococcus aetherivorans]|nr:hypothetical protein EBESD8_18850 [Rhodococcus aetherivorans]
MQGQIGAATGDGTASAAAVPSAQPGVHDIVFTDAPTHPRVHRRAQGTSDPRARRSFECCTVGETLLHAERL